MGILDHPKNREADDSISSSQQTPTPSTIDSTVTEMASETGVSLASASETASFAKHFKCETKRMLEKFAALFAQWPKGGFTAIPTASLSPYIRSELCDEKNALGAFVIYRPIDQRAGDPGAATGVATEYQNLLYFVAGNAPSVQLLEEHAWDSEKDVELSVISMDPVGRMIKVREWDTQKGFFSQKDIPMPATTPRSEH